MSQTGDAFLDAFHALEPDVDVVVLPPVDDDLPRTDRSDAVAAARDTDLTVGRLLDESDLADLVAHPRTVFAGWQRQREDVHTHRTRARVQHADDRVALDSLLRVRDTLRAAGWAPAPVDSPTPWLVATTGTGLHVEAVVEGTELVVTVTSPPLRLDAEPR